MLRIAPSEKDSAAHTRAIIPLDLLLPLCLAALSVASAADNLTRREWTVDGVVREALVYVPPQARTNATPAVFAFHGHGGSMHNAARSFSYHTRWPEVLVVYMQGLNTPGRLTDPEGRKPGWQHAVGDHSDRDLKFFDTVLASLQQDYRVDDKRIYATGHSNGGGFTYLLWAARGDRFAAFAPSACVARALVSIDTLQRSQEQEKPAGEKTKFASVSLSSSTEERDGVRSRKHVPKPVLHVAGENDTLVKFAWQQETINALRKVNQCGEGQPCGIGAAGTLRAAGPFIPQGQPWEGEKGCTMYPSKLGAPVVTFIHPGTHQFPAPAAAILVKFFKQHSLP